MLHLLFMRTHRMLSLAPFAALLCATNALAQPRIRHPVQLEYIRGKGTEACAGEGMLRHVIVSRMKEDPFVPAAPAKVRVAILRVGSAFQPSYELLNEAGEYVSGHALPRRDDCINAAEDVGISVSAHMPLLVTDSTPAPPDPIQPPAPSSPPPTKLPSRALPPGGGGGGRRAGGSSSWFSLPPIRLQVDAGVLVSVGTAPSSAFGFSGHVGARWSFFSLSVGVRGELPAGDGKDNIHITISRILFEAVSCLHIDKASVGIFGCGLIEAGELSYRLQTPYRVKKDHRTSVSAGGRAGVAWSPRFLPSGLGLYGAVDLMGTVRKTNILLNPLKYDWQADDLTGGGGVGVFYAF